MTWDNVLKPMVEGLDTFFRVLVIIFAAALVVVFSPLWLTGLLMKKVFRLDNAG